MRNAIPWAHARDEQFSSAVKEFEYAGTRAFYRPAGETTLEQGAEKVAEALRKARELGLEDMVANFTGFSGFSPPGVFDRYNLMSKWVQAAGPLLRVAFVVRADLIDPQKIGLLMYQNRGGAAEVFTNEPDALRWLDDRLRSPRK